MVLMEKLQKYQPYHQAKLTRMNMLLVNKYQLLIKKTTAQTKFTYSPLEKAFEKQVIEINEKVKLVK